MPSRPPRICGKCGSTVHGRCPTCAAAYHKQRGTTSELGYDAAWRRLRNEFLLKHPMCVMPGCGGIASEVDHIQTVRARPDLRLTWSNLRPMCHRCHSRRTMQDQHAARRAAKAGGA